MSIRSLVPAFFVLTLASACGDTTHDIVYTAQAYDADNDCIEAASSLALVEESSVSANCSAVCLDFNDTLYVSTLCPPYPDGATKLSPADSAACNAALAVYSEYLADDAHEAGSCDSE